MKVYVFGFTGMLGRYVYTYLKSKNYDAVGISRETIDASVFNEQQLKSALSYKGFRKGDIVINCMGTIKPQVDKLGVVTAIKVNSLFPHYLANICEQEGYKMIHITTDCVFGCNGEKNTEELPHDCTDVYGKTKSLGEPNNCTVVRSSIIGEEVGQSRSLIEWVKSMENKSANGYTNHYWNGVTCLQMAKVFEIIISSNKYWIGVRHIFSPEIVNKYELVQMISDIHGLNVHLTPVEAPTKCDRSLSTIYTDTDIYIPPLKEQIEEQFNYFNKDNK